MIDTSLSDWLLDSDPVLRWHVECDLLGIDEDAWRETRRRVPFEGFGRELLSRQDTDGQWAGGVYFPSDFRGEGPQPWTATTWALNDLRDWRAPASAREGTAVKLAPVK